MKRIQRRRTKGWRMPKGAVYVGRPTKWGNPYRLDSTRLHAEHVLAFYEARLRRAVRAGRLDLSELRGKDLACWCPLDSPCHADVLLRLVADEVEP